ncbi:MAG TPA: hypothetical protein VF898_12965, partial [Chloroflexota bacterium]
MIEPYASWLEKHRPEIVPPALAAVIHFGGRCRQRHLLVLVITMNVLALALYLWSLQERIHVSIQATPVRFVARVGDDAVALPRPARGGGVGIYAGPVRSLLVSSTGQGAMPTDRRPLALLGGALRLVGPQPAWEDIRLQDSSRNSRLLGCRSPCPALGSTAWGGMTVSAGGDSIRETVFSTTTSRRYTVTADLLRGEAAQGLLVDIDRVGHGYLLQIRMDRPDAGWFEWNHGQVGHRLAGRTLTRLQSLPMLQRTLRLLLTSFLVAQILVALLLATFGAGLALARISRRMARPLSLRYTRTLPLSRVADAAGLLLAIAGGGAALLIADQIFDRVPHGVDAVAYLFQARVFALQRLYVPAPALPRFFGEMHLLVYHGHWFTHDTPGWPLLLAAGVAMGVPWLVNPMLAAGTMLLLYLTGREVYGRPTALIATALLLTSPFFLFLGGSYMSHTLTLFCLMGFTYTLIHWQCGQDRKSREGSEPGPCRRLLFLAGVFLGMAFITRQMDTVAFALPFALLVVRRTRAGLALLLGAIGPILFMFFYNWELSGRLRINLYTMQWTWDHPGFGPNVGPSGFTPAQGLWNTSYRLEMLHAHLFGWPFYTALALAMVPFVIGHANRWDGLFGASAVCVMTAYVFFWWPGISYGPRYWSATIPAFALLAARGLVVLYRLPFRLRFRPGLLVSLLGPCLLAALLVLYNLTFYLPAQLPIYREYDYMSPAPTHAVQRADLHHALVFVVTRPRRWSYGEVFPGNSPLLDGSVIYVRDRKQRDIVLMKRYRGWSFYRLDDTRL